MNETLAGQVEHLVTKRTGLKLRLRQRETLQTYLASHVSTLKLRDEGDYCQLLEDGGPDSESEWQHLARLLTNKESYFFRDKGQMALLRDRILPDLIDRNKPTQTLRIWSAGCSTGEEAYSLSILVNGLLAELDLPNWRITVIGTDIDGKALKHARQGMYGSWSFRMVDQTTRRRYFCQHKDGWQLREPFCSSVDFMVCNLVADTYPSISTGLFDMDLILCRNVFIYFEPQAIAIVLDKFARTLRDGGYLMTGHVETRGLNTKPLISRSFPGSEVFQKGGPTPELNREIIKTRHPAPSLPVPAPKVARREEPSRVALSDSIDNKPEQDREKTLLSHARNLADRGSYLEAVEGCHRIIGEFPMSAKPYALLASIAQDQGRSEDAKALLKKALYLAPEEAILYMELGAHYLHEGDVAMARKMQDSALELLRNMPPDSTVGLSEGPSARECINYLTTVFGEGG